MKLMPTHERKTTPRPRRKRSRVNWHAIGRAAGVGAAVAVTAILALGLLAASGASSYDNLWHLAASHRVPIPRLNPLELDGGLVVITLLDIVLTWIGYPFAGLRFIARALGVGTIAANVAAGWPDPVGGFLRAFAPAIIVAITEAVRAVLLRRNTEVQEARKRKQEQRIPRARWLLAPWPTFVLWRRMQLWDITDYRMAVDMELSRRQAIVKLGDEWEETAPADLVWMLKTGVRMSDALERVAELTAPKPEVPAATGPGNRSRNPAASSARNRNRKPAATGSRKQQPATATVTALTDAENADLDTEAKALKILAEEPDISASELGRRLGRSGARGRQIVRKLAKAAPQGPDAGGKR